MAQTIVNIVFKMKKHVALLARFVAELAKEASENAQQSVLAALPSSTRSPEDFRGRNKYQTPHNTKSRRKEKIVVVHQARRQRSLV